MQAAVCVQAFNDGVSVGFDLASEEEVFARSRAAKVPCEAEELVGHSGAGGKGGGHGVELN